MHRAAHSHRRFKPWQKWMNVALTLIRGQVERVFGLMERGDGYRRVHHRGLVRNGRISLGSARRSTGAGR